MFEDGSKVDSFAFDFFFKKIVFNFEIRFDESGDVKGRKLKALSLRNRIAVPPMCQYMAVDGKANAELLALVAQQFGVAKSSVTLKVGAGSRLKLVRIEGLKD